MSDELKRTVRIARPSKSGVDDRGRNVSEGPVEEVELELVSTVMLKKVLLEKSESDREKLREAAEGKDGVLARHLGTNEFEIIDWPGQAEDASLVSTMALRRVLNEEEDEPAESGFDPYNSA